MAAETKAQIIERLKEAGIEFNEAMTKDELLTLLPDEVEDEAKDDELEIKKYKVIAKSLLRVRSLATDEEISRVKRDDILLGYIEDDKLLLEDDHYVKAEFVEEVK